MCCAKIWGGMIPVWLTCFYLFLVPNLFVETIKQKRGQVVNFCWCIDGFNRFPSFYMSRGQTGGRRRGVSFIEPWKVTPDIPKSANIFERHSLHKPVFFFGFPVCSMDYVDIFLAGLWNESWWAFIFPFFPAKWSNHMVENKAELEDQPVWGGLYI